MNTPCYTPFIYDRIITHDARAQGPSLVASRADKIFISALFANSIVRNTLFFFLQKANGSVGSTGYGGSAVC